VIPVLGFATLSRFDLAQRLLDSIDYPVEHLIIIDNSGKQEWEPKKPASVDKLWLLRMPYGVGLVGAWNLIVKSTPYAPYWLLVNDDAWFEAGALAEIAEKADSGALVMPDVVPDWSCIVLGSKVVEEVGLYDERFYPLYFDDNDYERRIRHFGLPIRRISAKIHHDNSSTLHSGFHEANNRSYRANQMLFDQKVLNHDYSEGVWSLKIRKANKWD
jgi:GT2 family glycosyltransferase